MCLLRLLVILPDNSRFGGFNGKKIPVYTPRELARKELIWFAVFSAATAQIPQNQQKSRFYGNYRELAASGGDQYLWSGSMPRHSATAQSHHRSGILFGVGC